MQTFKPQAVAGNKITVTTSPAYLYALMNTAASGSDATLAGMPSQLDAIDITPENGDIRYLPNDQDPTSSVGQLLKSGVTYYLRGIRLASMKLIAVTSSTTCNVIVGKAEVGETSMSSVTMQLGQPTQNNLLTPNDSTNIAQLTTKGIMIFGLASGSTATLNLQGVNDAAAVAIPFTGNGAPYIYYPGNFKLLKATGTTLSGASVYGLAG